MQAQIEEAEVLTFTRTLDGTLLADEELIVWAEPITPDSTHTRVLSVTNTGTVTCTVSIRHADLPLNWALTWDVSNPILAPDGTAVGILQLYVSADATPGLLYGWNCWICADEVVP